MSEIIKAACYREANGVRFTKNAHRHDCTDPTCRGCVRCPEPAHCTARPNCSWHIAEGQLTCGRCLAAVRRDLRWIMALAALMPVAAEYDGVQSEAAVLAGPTADPEAWAWRKVSARAGRAWHISLIEDDDEHHPANVLGTWARMLTEDYGHEMPFAAALSWTGAYLDRNLHRVAQDDEQDFPLLRRELRKCRQHLEAVLHNDDRPERGAPCPECTSEDAGVGPRLTRRYGHWCEDEACERMHHGDTTDDVWICPRNRDHSWSHEDYERWIAERRKVRSA